MALTEFLQRLAPIRKPDVIRLSDEELAWPKVRANQLTIYPVAPPEVSSDLVLQQPSTIVEDQLQLGEIVGFDSELTLTTGDSPLSVLDWLSERPQFEIVDVLESLAHPQIHGTIFVKKEKEVKVRGRTEVSTKVEATQFARKVGSPRPTGLDIFEMLLPVLMPPAATEFGEELLFPSKLYDFQRVGVKWLFENKSALLADDMGLGKTVQAITALRALIRRSQAMQALVVCPKSVLANWMREIERWAPELVAIRVHGNQASRRVAWGAYIGKCHVLVTTYETVRSDKDLIRGRVFDVIIADELQKIKNPRAAVSRAIRDLSAHRHWGLTGTPLENKLEDVAAIFEFVNAGLFQPSELDRLTPKLVRERIEPYMLRRRKEDVLDDLPKKIVDTKWLELGETQRRSYDRAESEGKLKLQRQENVTVQHVLQLIQYLKQVCNFDPETKESVKVEFLVDEFLPEACEGDQKALIFSQYVRTLESLVGEVEDYQPLVYTGQLSVKQRSQIEEAFKTNDDHKVLLLSLRAGGTGLNLERANYVLHFDRWWNPAVEHQAEDRVHRIGQERQVFVTRLICVDTIEERIEELLDEKNILFEQVVDELADVSPHHVLSEEQLFGLFGLTPPRRARVAASGGPPPLEPPPPPRPSIEAPVAAVIRPDTPFSNMLQVRNIIRECEEFLWWVDFHFHPQMLEELITSIDPACVNELRILSGPEHARGQAPRDFAMFKRELEYKRIRAEWRVSKKSFSHDRFIITHSKCFNVPPVRSLFKGSYSEINETPNRPPFEDWWDMATPLASRDAD